MLDDDEDEILGDGPDLRPSASDPGELELDFFVYQNCYRDFLVLLFFAVPAIALLVIGFIYSWIWLVLGALLLAFTMWSWSRWMDNRRRHVMYGDTCPAVVLNPENGLVAVYTDMTTGMGDSYPVIKIDIAPLSRSPFRPFKVNQRLTALCHYRGSPDEEHWNDIFPIMAVCATADKDAVQKTFEDIEQETWRDFAKALAGLKTREPGLYFINSGG